jgi:hypothetical protein
MQAMKRVVRNLAPVARQNTQKAIGNPVLCKLLNPATSATFSIMVSPEVDSLSFLLLPWSLLLVLDYFNCLPTF